MVARQTERDQAGGRHRSAAKSAHAAVGRAPVLAAVSWPSAATP